MQNALLNEYDKKICNSCCPWSKDSLGSLKNLTTYRIEKPQEKNENFIDCNQPMDSYRVLYDRETNLCALPIYEILNDNLNCNVNKLEPNCEKESVLSNDDETHTYTQINDAKKPFIYRIREIQDKIIGALEKLNIKIEENQQLETKSNSERFQNSYSQSSYFTNNHLVPCDLAIEEIVSQRTENLSDFIDAFNLILHATISFQKRFKHLFNFRRNECLHEVMNQLQTLTTIFKSHDSMDDCGDTCDLITELIMSIRLLLKDRLIFIDRTPQKKAQKQYSNKMHKASKRLQMYETKTKKVVTVSKKIRSTNKVIVAEKKTHWKQQNEKITKTVDVINVEQVENGNIFISNK